MATPATAGRTGAVRCAAIREKNEHTAEGARLTLRHDPRAGHSLPEAADVITAEWLQTVLRAAGCLPLGWAKTVTAGPVGNGMLSLKLRLMPE